ncbi:peptidase S8 [Lewinellaceae bacterium SD302]|nr:peptidase S8 [Lewinellaceae bacterium SD302]
MIRVLNYAILLLCCAIVFVGCEQENLSPDITEAAADLKPASDEGNIIADQYIFTFRPDVIAGARSYLDMNTIANREEKIRQMETYNAQVAAQIDDVLAQAGILPSAVIAKYTALEAGVALKLDEATYTRFSANPAVAAVEYDRIVELPPFNVESIEGGGTGRAQTTPCAINNAGGSVSANQSRWAWIIDSGIDLDHPDLNVVTNGTYARSFVGGSANDCNGHGTHVAGIVGAKNNSFGSRGVAANAPVVPVRVFGCSGGSASSTIINGINHVATYDYPGDVANLSLGGYYGSGCSNNTPYRNPILSLGQGGTYVCIAAGNSSANTSYYAPGCVNGTRVYTVSSMTCGNSFSSFSNYNMNPVDYIATGSSVYSTYLNGGYATLSGTSMATPVVAGICHARNAAPRKVGNVYNRGENYPIAKR